MIQVGNNLISEAVTLNKQGYTVFTFKSLNLLENGKKNMEGMPKWQKLEKSLIGENDKALAILTGEKSKIVVLDFDKKKGKDGKIVDGMEYFNKYKLGELDTPITKTQSGGYHLYVKYTDKLPKSTSKLKVLTEDGYKQSTIDVRSNGGCIIAPPTILQGQDRQYEWVKSPYEYKPIELPEDLLTLFIEGSKDIEKKEEKSNPKKEEDNTNIHKDFLECRKLLDMINVNEINGYNDWLDVGITLYNVFEGDDQGKSLWNMWSSNSPDYDKEEIEQRWKTFKVGEKTIGSLHKIARKNDPEKYTEFKRLRSLDDCSAVLDRGIPANNDHDLGNIFYELMKEDIIVFLERSKSKIYMANATTNIWKQVEKESLMGIVITECLLNYLNNVRVSADDPEKRQELQKHLECVKTTVKTNRKVMAIWKQVEGKFCNLTIKMDDKFKRIWAFKNGLVELDKITDTHNGFRPYAKNDYVSRTLDYDFNPNPPVEVLEDVEKYLRRIQPDAEQFDGMMEFQAYCSIPEANNKVMKLNQGSGDNGKSVVCETQSRVFPLYCEKLHNKTFDNGFNGAHKGLIHLINNPIRMMYIEEPAMTRFNAELFKDAVDGSKLVVNEMYGNTVSDRISAKLIVCSNSDLNIRNERAVRARGLLQKFQSEFIDDESKVDENNHIYLKNIERKLGETNDEKNAYIHLLMKYVREIYENEGRLKCISLFKDGFNDMLDDYDEFKEIIDEAFIRTNDEDDRVSKEDISTYLDHKLPIHRTWQGLLSQCKRIGLIYSKQKRCNRKQGCFLKLKMKTETEEYLSRIRRNEW